jgi:hypothetical protein
MTSRGTRGEPELTEFLAGYAGPPATEYRGGAVKVIAALIYGDGVLIEWLVRPVPDLSWIPDQQPSAEPPKTLVEQFRDQPHMVDRLIRTKRLSTFWNSATLSDDLGTQYLSGWGDSESIDGTAYIGHMAFGPAPRVQARELTLRVHDLTITIALDVRKKQENQ